MAESGAEHSARPPTTRLRLARRPAALVVTTALLLAGLLLGGCGVMLPLLGAQPTPTLVAPAVAPALATPPRTLAEMPATLTPLPAATAEPTATATADRPPMPTETPDPYAGLTVAGLAGRLYGGGELQVVETLTGSPAFARYLIVYPSDGLRIFGFMNVPHGSGPFPVALVLHGFVELDEYVVQDYTTPYADAMAARGYLVIHSNYRNHPPSDEGPNPFRVGYAVDVLNLIALVQQQGGRAGALAAADSSQIHLFGHSMGGGVALRVITISPAVRAAVLYSSMSGDEYRNFERIGQWSRGNDGQAELETPLGDLVRISPIFHLERITAAVSVHHGTTDTVVPSEWSDDLCQRLQQLGKPAECFRYIGQPHNFVGGSAQQLIERTLELFARH